MAPLRSTVSSMEGTKLMGYPVPADHHQQSGQGQCGLEIAFFLVSWSPPSHFLGQVFTEQSRGLDGQHHDQQCKGERITEGGSACTFDKALADADDEAADHRTGNGADAAEHRRDKGLQAGHGTAQWG